jgi:hypothetical protein
MVPKPTSEASLDRLDWCTFCDGTPLNEPGPDFPVVMTSGGIEHERDCPQLIINGDWR